MFAIIEDSGRQFKVAPGLEIAVDLREGLEEGGDLVFDRVLLANGGAGSVIGKPIIEGATIAASIVNPYFKGPKLEVQKFRRRKNSRRHTGHRQKYAVVKIGDFNVPGLEVVEQKAESAPAPAQTAASEETSSEE